MADKKLEFKVKHTVYYELGDDQKYGKSLQVGQWYADGEATGDLQLAKHDLSRGKEDAAQIFRRNKGFTKNDMEFIFAHKDEILAALGG